MRKLLTVVAPMAIWALAGTASVDASRWSSSVMPGSYCGTTVEGQQLCLRTSARAVISFRSWSSTECTTGPDAPPAPFVIPLRISGVAIPLRNRAFSVRQTKPITNDERRVSSLASSGSVSFTVKGVFTTTGKVSGTLVVESVTFDMDGDRYGCMGAPVRWNAVRQR